MRRFVSNRWCAFLFALLLAFSFASSFPTGAHAATVRDGRLLRTGAITPGGDYGDPDANGGGGQAFPGRMREGGSGTVVGDSQPGLSGVWMLRLQILLETYRGLLFRF
jgi:hypothetical protein